MYEWLKDYQRLEDEIDYLEHNLEQTKRELRRWTSGDLYGVALNEKSKGARIEEELAGIRESLFYKKEQQEKLLKLVKKFKGLDNAILRLKYIEGKTLEEIALETNYSFSHVSKKHAELVRTIKFLQEHVSL